MPIVVATNKVKHPVVGGGCLNKRIVIAHFFNNSFPFLFDLGIYTFCLPLQLPLQYYLLLALFAAKTLCFLRRQNFIHYLSAWFSMPELIKASHLLGFLHERVSLAAANVSRTHNWPTMRNSWPLALYEIEGFFFFFFGVGSPFSCFLSPSGL